MFSPDRRATVARRAATLLLLAASGAALGTRPAPAVLANLGKGQRTDGIDRSATATARRTLQLDSAAAIAQALVGAQAGDVLEISPGSYPIASTMRTGHAGTPGEPITLRARRAGTVTLQVTTTQAVLVEQPHWVFENLDWVGVCAHDDDCEHALHIVGPARGTVIVDNRMTDFNAHIKVNGHLGQWPDNGRLQFSTLTNTRPRRSERPATPFDLVGASGWQVLDNRVENFGKADSASPSYGIFMKGAGSGGRIERNVVVCAPVAALRPGQRVGISLGNGGTGSKWCRDGRCGTEHSDGLIANNIVAHCNEAGIEVSRAQRAVVAHNTLINTQGVLLRRPPASASVDGNLLDGSVSDRVGTELTPGENLEAWSLQRWLQDPDALDLAWRQTPPLRRSHAGVELDFCGRPRPAHSPPGAMLTPRC